MQTTKIEIKLVSKQFTAWNSNADKVFEEMLEKFLKENPSIAVQKKEFLRNVDYDGNPTSTIKSYNILKIYYYEGSISIANGSNEPNSISMTLNLRHQIIDLVLKAASGELKELVKSQYKSFENKLDELVGEAKKNCPFSSPYV